MAGEVIKIKVGGRELELNCFSWLHLWKTAQTRIVVGIQELYQKLLPTKVFYNRKTGTGKATESVSHILAGCGALAQTKHLSVHDNALKILLFEVIRSLDLISLVGPWYSKAQPKQMYENERAIAYCGIPLYADNTVLKANRTDATIVDKESETVAVLEMSCPWIQQIKREDR